MQRMLLDFEVRKSVGSHQLLSGQDEAFLIQGMPPPSSSRLAMSEKALSMMVSPASKRRHEDLHAATLT
jgi:hypothetical protein